MKAKISTRKSKFTRSQYLSKECSHEEYYGQFVTPAMVNVVASRIGVDRIRNSKDPNLNDIPLESWDAMTQFLCFGGPLRKALESAGDYRSMSSVVCTAKAAARQIISAS